jgi:hypothetical protein
MPDWLRYQALAVRAIHLSGLRVNQDLFNQN